MASVKIRQALIAIADHDLNASTFAARVTASTGALPAACVLAGLCVLAGPCHGGASLALLDLIEEVSRTDCDLALEKWLARGIEIPGFGHPLYPAGDPRAEVLLDGISVDPFFNLLREVVEERTGLRPNCDFALTVLSDFFSFPKEAPFRLFLIGRSVGWCAHAMEQCESGVLIRPRGRYVDH